MARLNLIPTMHGVSQASQLDLLIRTRLELDLSTHSLTNTTQSPLLGNGLEFYSGKFMRNSGLSEVFEVPPATLPVDSGSMT